MTAKVKAEIRSLVDQLPDDPAVLARVREKVVEELRLRDTVTSALEDRGATVEQKRVSGGAVFVTHQPDEPDLLLHALDTAPEDDEDLSPEEEARMTAAWKRYVRGEGQRVSSEELLRRIGE